MPNSSNFPTQLDTFNVLSDLQAADIDNARERKELMKMTASERTVYPDTHAGKTWQTRVDELTVLLTGKILISEDITKLQDAILNMQAYILEHDVYVGTTAPANPPQYKIWIDVS